MDYIWQNYHCAYKVYTATHSNSASNTPLLLIHPIGVGLSNHFWDRFCQEWSNKGYGNPIYSPDLLGCGDSDMPHVAYYPSDWAKQLQYFLQTVVQKPVILVVQGASLPIAIELTQIQTEPNYIRALVLSGPPTLSLINENTSTLKQRLNWNLFNSPFGNAFYRYARTERFLRSFSVKQLFANAENVDSEWLNTLEVGAKNLESRHAVFSFLAGFWRKDYQEAIASIHQPTFVVMGEQATSIARTKKTDSADKRLADYLKYFPNAEGMKMASRNIPPYESTVEFVQAIAPFIQQFS